MVRVMASGVFDILHYGHLYYLQEAKKLGDELVVVVARDSTVGGRKGEPVMPEELRAKMIQGLKPVDRCVLGREDDPYKTVEEIKPDIIALGYDQKHDEEALKKELSRRGLEVKVARIGKYDHDIDGTRKIIERISRRRTER